MKLKALFTCLLLLGLAGCADKAVVTLQDGSEILVKDHSDYDKYNDYYEFEQLNGETILIKKDNVRFIKTPEGRPSAPPAFPRFPAPAD